MAVLKKHKYSVIFLPSILIFALLVLMSGIVVGSKSAQNKTSLMSQAAPEEKISLTLIKGNIKLSDNLKNASVGVHISTDPKKYFLWPVPVKQKDNPSTSVDFNISSVDFAKISPRHAQMINEIQVGMPLYVAVIVEDAGNTFLGQYYADCDGKSNYSREIKWCPIQMGGNYNYKILTNNSGKLRISGRVSFLQNDLQTKIRKYSIIVNTADGDQSQEVELSDDVFYTYSIGKTFMYAIRNNLLPESMRSGNLKLYAKAELENGEVIYNSRDCFYYPDKESRPYVCLITETQNQQPFTFSTWQWGPPVTLTPEPTLVKYTSGPINSDLTPPTPTLTPFELRGSKSISASVYSNITLADGDNYRLYLCKYMGQKDLDHYTCPTAIPVTLAEGETKKYAFDNVEPGLENEVYLILKQESSSVLDETINVSGSDCLPVEGLAGHCKVIIFDGKDNYETIFEKRVN